MENIFSPGTEVCSCGSKMTDFWEKTEQCQTSFIPNFDRHVSPDVYVFVENFVFIPMINQSYIKLREFGLFVTIGCSSLRSFMNYTNFCHLVNLK